MIYVITNGEIFIGGYSDRFTAERFLREHKMVDFNKFGDFKPRSLKEHGYRIEEQEEF